MAAVLFAALCMTLFQLSLQQVAPAKLPLSGLCHVSQKNLRVLPSSGFSRSVLKPFTSTRTFGAPAPAPVSSVANLSGCLFQSYDAAFDAIIGANQTIYQVGPTKTQPWAVESPAYLSETDEIVFSSFFTQTPSTVSRLSLSSGQATTVDVNPPIGSAAGATSYNGQVAICSRGDAFDDANPPGAFLLDPHTGNSTILVNNFFGIRFNGFDDIQALSDGSLILTDTNYTSANFKSVAPGFPHFKNAAVLPNDVWILPQQGPPRVLVADLPNDPNGVAVSPDEKTLYVGVGPLTPDDPFAAAAVDLIYAYDLVNDTGGHFAENKRVFAKSDFGYFDGFVVDSQGNLFAATGDGVAVFNPAGTILGKIIIPASSLSIGDHPTNSVGFAGNRLIIMHDVGVLMLPLNTSGISRARGD